MLLIWINMRRGMLAVVLGGVLAGLILIQTVLPAKPPVYDPGSVAGKTVVIDPGHGGVDGGARGAGGLKEKDITLAIGQKLAIALSRSGARVIMTREADTDFYTSGKEGKRNDLAKRVEIANASGADLFISIHTNAIASSRWAGAQVFYHPESERSKLLAEFLQKQLAAFPPGNRRKALASDYFVLRDLVMPGVIVEAGFLSNPKEGQLLADPGYQERLAEALLHGIAGFFAAGQ